MKKWFVTFLTVLVFASPSLAGGFACDPDRQDCPGEMACCESGHSLVPSPAAAICCQTVCGEATSGAAVEATLHEQILTPFAAISFIAAFDDSVTNASVVAVLLSTAANAVRHHDPPALFLINSTFLI